MSILSNNFATPITFDNILEMCDDKPYEFCRKLYPHKSYKKSSKFIGETIRIYYSESDDTYDHMYFSLYEDKLIVISDHIKQVYLVDCAETVIMLMDDYFTKYKFFNKVIRL